MSQIRARNPFFLTDFGEEAGAPDRKGNCQAGRYVLFEGEHPNPEFRAPSGRPNRMFFLEGSGVGACLAWWQREVEDGRMKWVVEP